MLLLELAWLWQLDTWQLLVQLPSPKRNVISLLVVAGKVVTHMLSILLLAPSCLFSSGMFLSLNIFVLYISMLFLIVSLISGSTLTS